MLLSPRPHLGPFPRQEVSGFHTTAPVLQFLNGPLWKIFIKARAVRAGGNTSVFSSHLHHRDSYRNEVSPEILGTSEVKRRKGRKWLVKINTEPPPPQQVKQKEN